MIPKSVEMILFYNKHILHFEWGIDELFTWHRNQEQNVSALGAFSCYTEVLQSEVFISTVVGDVMTGVELTGVDGLGSK